MTTKPPHNTPLIIVRNGRAATVPITIRNDEYLPQMGGDFQWIEQDKLNSYEGLTDE